MSHKFIHIYTQTAAHLSAWCSTLQRCCSVGHDHGATLAGFSTAHPFPIAKAKRWINLTNESIDLPSVKLIQHLWLCYEGERGCRVSNCNEQERHYNKGFRFIGVTTSNGNRSQTLTWDQKGHIISSSNHLQTIFTINLRSGNRDRLTCHTVTTRNPNPK
jgi:hypothetical protein